MVAPGRLANVCRTHYRGWVKLLVVLAALVAAEPAVAKVKPGTGVIPVKLVFAGTGTFSIDQTYEDSSGNCTEQTTDPMSLTWQATYHTVIDHGVLKAGTGAVDSGPGSLAFSATSTGAQGCSQVAPIASPPCSAAIPSPGSTPGLTVSGGSTDAPIDVQAQSVTALGGQPACGGVGGPVFEDRDLSVFATVLPGGLTAVATIPAGALGTGSYLTHVSSSNALTQAPSQCVGVGAPANGNTECSASMNWSGTLTFTADCGANASVPMPCVKKQTKDDAAEAADDYNNAHALDQESYKGLGCGPGASNYDSNDVKYACAAMASKNIYDAQMASHEQAIADDPPDSGFAVVPKPSPVKLPLLRLLASRAPSFVKLANDYARAAALIAAAATAQNRATGAYLAGANNAAIIKQGVAQAHAVRAYTRSAAAILAGQAGLSSRAQRELRKLGKPGTRVATLLSSARTATANRIAAAGLTAISTG